MYGPHYVWMLVNSYNNNWWIPGKNEELACSDLEMKCQIQNHFSFYHTFVINPRSRYYNHAQKVSDIFKQVLNTIDRPLYSIFTIGKSTKKPWFERCFFFLFTEWVSNNQ